MYDEQQIRFEKAFRGIRTMCVVDCHCGRVHFVSSDGHGDYEEGELDELLKKASEQPEKYIAEEVYDYLDAAFIDGKQIVVDCPCGGYKKYCDWIESWADELCVYLSEFMKSKKASLERDVVAVSHNLDSINDAVHGGGGE